MYFYRIFLLTEKKTDLNPMEKEREEKKPRTEYDKFKYEIQNTFYY